MGKSAGTRWAAVALVLATTAFLLACGKDTGQGPSGSSGPAEPIRVDVRLSDYPKLYEPVLVTVTITPMQFDVPGAEAWIELPISAVYLGGDLTWSGNLIKSQPVFFSASLAFTNEGSRAVYARLWALPTAGAISMGGLGGVTFHVGKDRGGPSQRGSASGEAYMHTPGASLIGHKSLVRVPTTQSRGNAPVFFVVRDREELKALQESGQLPQSLRFQWREVERLDFNKQMLIGLQLPSTGRLGYIFRIEERGGRVDVQLWLNPTPVPAELRGPAVAVLEIVAVRKDYFGFGPKEFVLRQGTEEFQRAVYEIK